MSGLEIYFELSVIGELVTKKGMFSNIQKFDFLSQCPPLVIAIIRDDPKMVRVQLEAGADPNECDDDGFTPLMAAAIFSRKEIIRILLEHGVNVNAKTKEGHTALVYASFFSDSECVKMLVDAGADLSTPRFRHDNSNKTFPEALSFYMREYTAQTGQDISTIYKNTEISEKSYALSKQTFSKINRNINSNKKQNYHPKKNTILLLAFGMRLNLEQTEDLLLSAGYSLDENSRFDMIVRKSIEEKKYDLGKINDILFKETGRTVFRFWEKDDGREVEE